jgi:hypothetical protein
MAEACLDPVDDGRFFMMHSEIGAVVLGSLSAMFAGYGVRELALAYETAEFHAWGERALPGAGGVFLAVVFAFMTFQIIV